MTGHGECAAHPQCVREGTHMCFEPSGRTCIEQGCDEPAGTSWGPYWCPEHDEERLNRISASLSDLARPGRKVERE